MNNKSFLIFLFCAFLFPLFSLAQNDSVLAELKRIQANNQLLRLKDSIRAAIVKEELGSLNNPKSKELERYKNELAKIKQQDSLRIAQQKAAIESLRSKVQPYPVQLDHKTLFNVYAGLGPFSAKDRAVTAAEQIHKIYGSKVYYKDSLKIQPANDYINIVYRGDVVTSISEEDALWEDTTPKALATVYRDAIDKNVREARNKYRFKNTALRWITAIGIILAFLVVVKLLRWLFTRLSRKLVKSAVKDSDGIKIKNYQFIDKNQLKKLTINSLKYLHGALFIVILGLASSMLFSVFPATESWAYTLLDWLWIPLKDLARSFYHYLPNLFRIGVIIFIARYAAKLLRYFSLEIERGELRIRGFHPEWGLPTYHLLRICLFAFTLIIIFPYLPGSNTNAFKGVSVFFGVILSLGSSSAIANTIAGFIITYMRPFKVGDWIKVNEVIGEVLEKTALVTRLRTINNEDVTLPNSMILTSKTINFSSSSPDKGLILNAEVSIRHDVSQQMVNYLLVKAAMMTDGVLHDPKPYVFKLKINETSVTYQLNATTLKPQKMYFITSDLNENILKVFGEAGIDLITPQYYKLPDA